MVLDFSKVKINTFLYCGTSKNLKCADMHCKIYSVSQIYPVMDPFCFRVLKEAGFLGKHLVGNAAIVKVEGFTVLKRRSHDGPSDNQGVQPNSLSPMPTPIPPSIL